MSLPKHLKDQLSLAEYTQPSRGSSIEAIQSGIPIHFTTFATSNWKFAHERNRVQLDYIQKQYNFFSSTSVNDEHSLDTNWHSRFDRFSADHAYAMWSWKPYIIKDTLNKSRTGDIVIYFDGGCSFPIPEKLSAFLNTLTEKINDIHNGDYFCALTKYPHAPIGCVANASKKLLSYFNIEHDDQFLYEFPHWQTGVQILVNKPETKNLIDDWCDAMNNYESVIKRDWCNKDGELPGFCHDGGDQGIFQALLYKNKYRVLDISDFIYNSGVIAHIRR